MPPASLLKRFLFHSYKVAEQPQNCVQESSSRSPYTLFLLCGFASMECKWRLTKLANNSALIHQLKEKEREQRRNLSLPVVLFSNLSKFEEAFRRASPMSKD